RCWSATAQSTALPPRPSSCTTTATPMCITRTSITMLTPMKTPTPEPGAAMNTNTVTEQLTAAGRAIEHDSFAIIDAEVDAHAYTASQWPVVRRIVHANADFDFNGLPDLHPDAVEAGPAGNGRGVTRIVADCATTAV